MHAANCAGVRPVGGFSFLLWHFNSAAAFLATHFFLAAEQALSVACDDVANARAMRAPTRAKAMRCMDESSFLTGHEPALAKGLQQMLSRRELRRRAHLEEIVGTPNGLFG